MYRLLSSGAGGCGMRPNDRVIRSGIVVARTAGTYGECLPIRTRVRGSESAGTSRTRSDPPRWDIDHPQPVITAGFVTCIDDCASCSPRPIDSHQINERAVTIESPCRPIDDSQRVHDAGVRRRESDWRALRMGVRRERNGRPRGSRRGSSLGRTRHPHRGTRAQAHDGTRVDADPGACARRGSRDTCRPRRRRRGRVTTDWGSDEQIDPSRCAPFVRPGRTCGSVLEGALPGRVRLLLFGA